VLGVVKMFEKRQPTTEVHYLFKDEKLGLMLKKCLSSMSKLTAIGNRQLQRPAPLLAILVLYTA